MAQHRWMEPFGLDVERQAGERRRFAWACLDWSERGHCLGGALGAALLRQGLIERDLDSQALDIALESQGHFECVFNLAA